MITITLKSYLAKLQEEESKKPSHERREVPTLSGLAKEIGIHYSNLSKLVNNRGKALRFDTASAILEAMRSRGFDMQLSDMITG